MCIPDTDAFYQSRSRTRSRISPFTLGDVTGREPLCDSRVLRDSRVSVSESISYKSSMQSRSRSQSRVKAAKSFSLVSVSKKLVSSVSGVYCSSCMYLMSTYIICNFTVYKGIDGSKALRTEGTLLAYYALNGHEYLSLSSVIFVRETRIGFIKSIHQSYIGILQQNCKNMPIFGTHESFYYRWQNKSMAWWCKLFDTSYNLVG